MLPANRRALWEHELRTIARDCGVKCFDSWHAAQNSSCVLVKADGIILTGHCVDGPHQIVRDAKSREQNAGVNSWLNTFTDERLLLTPLPKLGKNPIYVNLLHGAKFPNFKSEKLDFDETSCFLRIAVPDHESERYLHNWAVQEILQAYSEIESVVGEGAIADIAHPRRKKIAHVKAKKAGEE